MKNKQNWEKTKTRFNEWWKCSNKGTPLMKVVIKLGTPSEPLEPVTPPLTPRDLHLDVERKVKDMMNSCRSHAFVADAFPNLNLNIGPGSMATYLGSEPVFAWNTVWFKESVHDWSSANLEYNPHSSWLNLHLDLIKRAQELAGDQFLINIPDIIEGIDILAALKGPQAFCYDLMDEPELVDVLMEKIDSQYFKYYDAFYNLVKGKDGGCSFTAYDIWAPGRLAKVQCDFSAMMSPAQYDRYMVPSLEKQCKNLDFVMYHLDGPDAIRHIDSILGIKGINALQWAPGAGKPDCSDEMWYPLYKKVRAANKALWLSISDGGFDDWLKGAEKLVKTFGCEGLYLLFPVMEEHEADKLLNAAEKSWS